MVVLVCLTESFFHLSEQKTSLGFSHTYSLQTQASQFYSFPVFQSVPTKKSFIDSLTHSVCARVADKCTRTVQTVHPFSMRLVQQRWALGNEKHKACC